MAILKGKDGTVSLAGAGVAGVVQSWNVSVETDTLETTSMGTAGWKTFEGSLQSWSGTVELYYSDANDYLHNETADTDSYISGSSVAVSLSDGTNTYVGSAVVTSAAVDVSVADLVTMSLDLTGSGELVIT